MYCNSLKARFGFYCFQELSCSVNNALFCYFQSLAENDLNTFEFKSLSDAVDEIKKTIDPSNIRWATVTTSSTTFFCRSYLLFYFYFFIVLYSWSWIAIIWNQGKYKSNQKQIKCHAHAMQNMTHLSCSHFAALCSGHFTFTDANT